MLKLLWRLRAAFAYRRITRISMKHAWDMAGTLAEDLRPDGYSPIDAVREDISCWEA